MKILKSFNIAKGVQTKAPCIGNEITEDYYWFLVGEINRGTMSKAVCRIENRTFGITQY